MPTKQKPVDILLPTTNVGALPRPSWYTFNLEGRDVLQALKNFRNREAFFDALRIAIGDQELAGIDILSDGKIWYDEIIAGYSWIDYHLERLTGLSRGPSQGVTREAPAVVRRAAREAPAAVRAIYEAHGEFPAVVEKVGRGPLRTAELFRIVSQYTSKPIKFGIVDPTLLSRFLVNRYYKSDQELTLDICRIYNEELKSLVAAGCKNIQLEDPGFIHTCALGGTKDDWNFAKEAWEATTNGVDATIWLHMCWGSPAGQSVWDKIPGYKFILPNLLDFKNLDVINIESAYTNGIDYPLFKEYPSDHLVALGAVTHRVVQIESAEQVAELIRKALKYIDPDRLITTTDCGLGRQSITRFHATYKLKALVEGTKIVRNELGKS